MPKFSNTVFDISKEKNVVVIISNYLFPEDGKRIFEFKNTGNEPLIIKDAKSSCGCTIPSFPKNPIPPGGSDKIEVQYNMNPGPISKTITVTTNAVNKENGMIALRIKGMVIVKEEPSIIEKKKEGPRL